MKNFIIVVFILYSISIVFSARGDLIWRYKTGDSVKSSPYVNSTTVFVGSNDTYIYALKRTNGDLIWRYKTGGEVISSPYLYGNMIFAGSRDGVMYAIQADNGSILWTFNAGQPIISSPNIHGYWSSGRLVLGSDNSKIYEIDYYSGEIYYTTNTNAAVVTKADGFTNGCPWYSMGDISGTLWTIIPGQGIADRINMQSPIYSSVAVHGSAGYRYFGTIDGKMHCLNTAQHSPLVLWEYQTEGAIYSSPKLVVSKGKLYFGSRDGYLYSLYSGDGSLEWRFKTNGSIDSSPFYYYNYIFFGSNDSYVYCIKATDGSLYWKYQTGGEVNSSPSVSLGTVIVGSNDGYIYAIETSEETDFDKQENYSIIPAKSFSASPNPFSSRLSISLPSSGAVYSLTGQLVMNLTKGKHSLDTSKWKEGVYVVKAGKECKRVVKVN
ncbi:MAG: PQQ-binding-like beta-propeller repeat protein [Candidatus Coatesbacteria bacterium]|nr:PQQ-binding-like beta-propeller repeat protein [Candidatus Coatesbacteria bacterium]